MFRLPAVSSKAVVLSLLIYCLMCYSLFMGPLCLSLFCCAVLCVHSGFAVVFGRGRKLVALLLLTYGCIIAVNVLRLFLTGPWVGLQCVIVVFVIILTYFLEQLTAKTS